MTRTPFRSRVDSAAERAALAWSAAGNMRQKAGPGLPLHLPILYRKANSNSSGCLPFAPGSGLKGFMHANFRRIFGCFFTGDGVIHGCRGRSAPLGVDALLATVPANRLGLTSGYGFQAPWPGVNAVKPETRASEPLRYY